MKDSQEEVATVEVQRGPGVAADATEYTVNRLRELARYAHRPIDAIRARITRQHGASARGTVRIQASLAVGDRVLRAEADTADARSSLDAVCDRLRRQLADLPHGHRGDYVAHKGDSDGR